MSKHHLSSSLASIPLFLLVLLLVIQPISAHNTFSYYISPYDTHCFTEILAPGDLLDWSFETMAPVDLDMEVVMTGPDGRLLKSVARRAMGADSFHATMAGSHKLCFNNVKSSNEKLIYFTLSGPEEHHKLSKEAQLKEDTDGAFLKVLQELSDEIRFMRDEQAMLSARAKRHLITLESTKSRVFWWTMIQGGIVIGIVVVQVGYIRSFFSQASRRLV